MPKLKRVNSMPLQSVLQEVQDAESIPNALVGGGAGSGLGPGHMTTLTSFNISAIHNNQIESPQHDAIANCEKDLNL